MEEVIAETNVFIITYDLWINNRRVSGRKRARNWNDKTNTENSRRDRISDTQSRR